MESLGNTRETNSHILTVNLSNSQTATFFYNFGLKYKNAPLSDEFLFKIVSFANPQNILEISPLISNIKQQEVFLSLQKKWIRSLANLNFRINYRFNSDELFNDFRFSSDAITISSPKISTVNSRLNFYSSFDKFIPSIKSNIRIFCEYSEAKNNRLDSNQLDNVQSTLLLVGLESSLVLRKNFHLKVFGRASSNNISFINQLNNQATPIQTYSAKTSIFYNKKVLRVGLELSYRNIEGRDFSNYTLFAHRSIDFNNRNLKIGVKGYNLLNTKHIIFESFYDTFQYTEKVEAISRFFLFTMDVTF